MCGRATVVNADGITEKVYGFTRRLMPGDWKPRYNLNPREQIPIVYYDPFLRERVVRTAHWNLIPSTLESRQAVDAFDARYSTFNARIETVATAPTFRDSWRSRRCLVVVDGIIEWPGEKGHKIPHLIRHTDRRSFAMAGLWDCWRDKAGSEDVWSCTIIVGADDEWYSRFHNRMAVLLDPGIYDAWLDSRQNTRLEFTGRHAYREEGELEFFPISRRVNNPQDDSPECLAPAEPV